MFVLFSEDVCGREQVDRPRGVDLAGSFPVGAPAPVLGESCREVVGFAPALFCLVEPAKFSEAVDLLCDGGWSS